MLVDTTPLVGPAARFGELPLVARLSAGVLLLGAALFAFQRLRRGSGCESCHRPFATYCLWTCWPFASAGAQVGPSGNLLQVDGQA